MVELDEGPIFPTRLIDPPSGKPADRDLRIVRGNEIGAGGGLDEAEEGRVHPLDGKPWDASDPDEEQ